MFAFLSLPVAEIFDTPHSAKRDRLTVATVLAGVLAVGAGVGPRSLQMTSLVCGMILIAAATWYSRFAKAIPRPESRRGARP